MIEGNKLILLDKRLSQAKARELARDPAYSTLEVIKLWGNRLSPKALVSLLKQPPPGLRELEIVDNKLGVEGARRLASVLPVLAKLERLDLHHNELGVAGLELLVAAGLDTLRELGLRENQLGLEGATMLGACSLPALEVLRIGDNAFGDAGIAAVAPRLEALVELHCGDNELGPAAMEVLAQAEQLEVLDLERNSCGPRGAQALANLRAPLREFDLYWNDIGPEGAKALFDDRTYPQLERLHLRANKLGDAGARALARANMPKLEALSIEDNAIGPEGSTALAQSPMLAKLSRLALHTNKFGPEGVLAWICSPTLPLAIREDATVVLQNYLDDEQVAGLAKRGGVEAQPDKRATLLALARAEPSGLADLA